MNIVIVKFNFITHIQYSIYSYILISGFIYFHLCFCLMEWLDIKIRNSMRKCIFGVYVNIKDPDETAKVYSLIRTFAITDIL